MEKRPKQVAAGGLAALVLAGGAGAVRQATHGAEEVVHIHPPPRAEVPVPAPGPIVRPSADAAQQIELENYARTALCNVVGALYDSESRGEISRDEVLQGVASYASQAALGFSVTAVQDAADQVLATENIYGDLGPTQAYRYAVECFGR
jgi:hypothetical protein